jgi:hypothetical protein
VADTIVPAVEALGVHEVEAVHPAREMLARGFDHEVEMVVEDAVRMQEPAEAPLRLVDPAHDGVAVEVVAHDGLPRDAADGHVNDAMRREERRAGGAGH